MVMSQEGCEYAVCRVLVFTSGNRGGSSLVFLAKEMVVADADDLGVVTVWQPYDIRPKLSNCTLYLYFILA